MIDRFDNMTNPVITFVGGTSALLLSWFSGHVKTLATMTSGVVLPSWMEWSQAIGSWFAGVGGGIITCISLYLLVRGRLLAKKGGRRSTDGDGD